MDDFIHELRWEHDVGEWKARARRELATRFWHRYGGARANRKATILDLGCGTGATMQALSQFGHVMGIDISRQAVAYCRLRALSRVAVGDAARLPFADSCFDLVTIIEVLEHVDKDEVALWEIARTLAPGGSLILTVPAFGYLWTNRDVKLQHKRRYTVEGLTQKVIGAGLTVVRCTYIDSFLFPALFVMAKFGQFFRSRQPLEVYAVTAPDLVNTLLLGVCRAERLLYSRVNLPVGISIAYVARRPA